MSNGIEALLRDLGFDKGGFGLLLLLRIGNVKTQSGGPYPYPDG
jgi:hypothetical protein